MDEKKKFFLTILLGMAGLFLLITRFCLPINKDNKKHIAQYRQLKKEVEFMEEFKKGELDSIEERMDTAIRHLEGKIPTKGKLKLAEHLTQASSGGGIIFKSITHRESQERQDYQIIPVDVIMNAPFYDFIKYLAAIEASSLFIGVDSLTIQRDAKESGSLDIKATFSGFKLTHQFPSVSKYVEEKYDPFDKNRLNKLFETVQLRDTKDALLSLKDYDPFVSVYDFELPIEQEEVISQPIEEEEEAVFSQQGEEEEVLPDPQAIIDSLSLRGIINKGDEKAALINDTIVKQGEEIADMQVVEIQDYRVILMHSNKTFILKMGVDNALVKP